MDRNKRLAKLMEVYQKGQTVRQYFYHDSGGNKLWSSWPTDEDELGSPLTVREFIPDFSTPEWRARLMDLVVQADWRADFFLFVYKKYLHLPDDAEISHGDFTAYLWHNFASLVDEYWQERGK